MNTLIHRTSLINQKLELEEQLKQLESELDSVDNTYWVINGTDTPLELKWDDDWEDYAFHSVGDVFWSYEDAVQETMARKTLFKLFSQPGARNFELYQQNWTIGLQERELHSLTFFDATFVMGRQNSYFSSRLLLQQAVDAVGEAELVKALQWFNLGKVL